MHNPALLIWSTKILLDHLAVQRLHLEALRREAQEEDPVQHLVIQRGVQAHQVDACGDVGTVSTSRQSRSFWLESCSRVSPTCVLL